MEKLLRYAAKLFMLISREETCPRTYSGQISILEPCSGKTSVGCEKCDVYNPHTARVATLFLWFVIFESAQNRWWLLTRMSIAVARRLSLGWLLASERTRKKRYDLVDFFFQFDVLLREPLMEQNGRHVYGRARPPTFFVAYSNFRS